MRNLHPSFQSFELNEDTEKRLIFKALHQYKEPLTRRFLSEVTGLEIAVLCRVLFDLANKYNLLKIAKIKPCPKTGKRVYHYYFAEEGAQNEN